MANEFRPIVINFLWIGLFAVAIITAGIMIAVQNNAKESISNDTVLYSLATSLSGNLSNNYEQVKQSEQSFENSSVTLTSGIPFIDSIYGAWKVIKSTPMLVYNLIVNVIFLRILGDSATFVIISVISTILIISIIFAIVKLISTGEGG